MRRAVIVACLICGAQAHAGLLESAGRDIGAGAVESIQPVLVSTLADAEARATRLEDHVGVVAGGLIEQANARGQDRLDQVDRILEARLLQVQVEATDATDHALSGVEQLFDNSLMKARQAARDVAKDVVTDVQAALSTTLQQASDLVQARLADVQREVDGAIAKADRTLAERIAQVDEVVGRRLGNVDVIASKQRIAIEETAVRLAVLIGLVVFTVFVLRRLYAQYGKLTSIGHPRAGNRTLMFARGLGVPLLGHLVVAALGAGVLLVLYDRLPFGARAEASQLVALHRDGFADSLAHFDFTRARFHASQLEYLAPEDPASHGGLLAKTELVRDVFDRPTLFATDVGITELWKRLDEARRLTSPVIDPDLLVVEAMLRWQTGLSRRDELRAASLCARALRLRPSTGGFGLAPLARAYVETFVDAPYTDDQVGLARDRYALDDLRAVLDYAPPVDPAHPLAPRIELLRLMRTLDGQSSTAYFKMIDAHGRMRAARGADLVRAAQIDRTRAANQVLAAWKAFDAALAGAPELARDPSVLLVFRLDDAQYVRAKWFFAKDWGCELAPLLGASPDKPTGKAVGKPADKPCDRASPRSATPAERLALAPPRLVWARRYRALIDGPARALFELQEANRFAAMERAAATFEQAMVAAAVAARPAQPTGALSAAERVRLDAAAAAAVLGLYVSGAQLGTPRGALARTLAPARLEIRDLTAYQQLEAARRVRGIRLL